MPRSNIIYSVLLLYDIRKFNDYNDYFILLLHFEVFLLAVTFTSRYSPSTIFLHYKFVGIMLMYCLCICSHIYPSVNMPNMNDLGKGKETKQQIFAALQVRTANSP